MVWDVENGAGCERYVIHPSKSHTLKYQSSKKGNPELSIVLNGSRADITNRAVHLGILSDTSNRVDTEGKISMGRRHTHFWGWWLETDRELTYLVNLCYS